VNAYTLALPSILIGYLIGAIPFGYLTALWVRGIDIRTVGSGNIGATNVGRVLGFRFFVLVFVLDLLKGFLPTYLLPKLVARYSGDDLPQLGVLIALAAILGHNFPIYLKLRGGKGVATSLGALLALDWVASVAAAAGFLVALAVTGYVSLLVAAGGVVFLAAYFIRVDDPWNRDHMAMSVVTIGLVGLLIVRHRKNLGRIRAGTEPRVSLRKKPPAGRVAWILIPVLALAVVVAVHALAARITQRSRLMISPFELVEVDRVSTGHQRAERVVYADGGQLLAVTCPRYNRLVLYRVAGNDRLVPLRDVELGGKPMAVRAARGRLFVLERPIGDRRHVEPGWWQTFNFQGDPLGPRQPAGMYPDDLALTPDGRHALILTSGRGEGDPGRPAPALDVLDLGENPPRAVGHLEFDRPGDDPGRLTLSSSGRCATVSLAGSSQVVSIDLFDPEHPTILARTTLADDQPPHLSKAGDDSIMMGIAPDRDAVLIAWPEKNLHSAGCVASTLPRGSGLTVFDAATRRLLGQLPLHAGSLNLSEARPVGLAFSPERGLLAVASRAGAVHLIAIKTRDRTPPPSARNRLVRTRGRATVDNLGGSNNPRKAGYLELSGTLAVELREPTRAPLTSIDPWERSPT